MCCNRRSLCPPQFHDFCEKQKLIRFIRLSYLSQRSEGQGKSFCLTCSPWGRKAGPGNQVGVLGSRAGERGGELQGRGARCGRFWDGKGGDDALGAASQPRTQSVKVRAGWGKRPKAQTSGLGLEIISVRRRQLSRTLPRPVSAARGGVWVGFTFWSLATCICCHRTIKHNGHVLARRGGGGMELIKENNRLNGLERPETMLSRHRRRECPGCY